MQTFEMNQLQLDKLMNACKPTPVMFLSGGTRMFNTPQANANHAWKLLAKELGFKWDTVGPSGKGDRFFNADPI